jgi:hypothetical protein
MHKWERGAVGATCIIQKIIGLSLLGLFIEATNIEEREPDRNSKMCTMKK